MVLQMKFSGVFDTFTSSDRVKLPAFVDTRSLDFLEPTIAIKLPTSALGKSPGS
jgi:hypothetical protein